ncbi:hypothetical protein [Roseinatronobacter alkalisoli]|uniref:Lipoprotein n=1 Tax=Roseinatronobacter alkalisoli TaxID=3028235 RepID=A0ABT5T9M3_9RHOB|nr:hypothetical protein [Roseinatronobacter sp. HJB301]MDD7971676.1 hypothetical protein [Roseinatronobacter sp. HJB301]
MRKILFTLPAALALSACIEVDLSLEVIDEDTARMTGFMQMQRQFFDMSGGDASFCDEDDGGTLTLTDTHARCDFDQTGTYAEIMNPEGVDAPDDDMQGSITYLGNNRTQVLLPLSTIAEDMAGDDADPAMMAMMRQMLAGMSINLSVTGARIESSSGVISEDGTRASITLDVDSYFAPAAEAPVDFDTIVEF